MSSQKKTILTFGFTDVKKKTDKLRIAKCKFCNLEITDAISTTSNFLRHMKTHTGRYEEFKSYQLQKEPDGACSFVQPKVSDSMFAPPPLCVEKSVNCYGLNHPKQRKIVKSAVSALIIGCSLPLSVVEKPQFHHFCEALDPNTRPMNRAVITTELERQYADVKGEIVELLEQADEIALTLDIWSDGKMRGFIGVTAHTILNFELQTRLLACERFEDHHTNDNIFDVFESICSSFKVKDKIRYIVTDTAGDMVKAFTTQFPCIIEGFANVSQQDLSETVFDFERISVENPEFWEDVEEEVVISLVQQAKFAHPYQPLKRLSCFEHALQLCVNDGLQEVKLHSALAKVSKICNLLHTSTWFKETFKKMFGPNVVIPQIDNTRWNTALHHINAFLALDEDQLEKVLDEVNHSNLKPSVREYCLLRELSVILQPFLDATNVVQADKEVTISAVVPSVVGLYHHLQNLQHPIYLENMVAALHNSLEARFVGILLIAGLLHMPQGHSGRPLNFYDYIYFIAAVLDPNFYFWWLQKISSNENETSALKRKIVLELRKFCTVLNLTQPRPQPSLSAVPPVKKACVSSLFDYSKPKVGVNSESGQIDFDAEMHLYSNLVTQNIECGPINVLKFWEKHCQDLPLLSKAALSVFMVPAGSAPVEWVFSEGGVVMRPHGSKLGGKHVEKIVFLKCNMDKLE